MNPESGFPGSDAERRRKAEELLQGKLAQTPENLEVLSPEATRRMLHELRVHQVELELQNEELRKAQVELNASKADVSAFAIIEASPVPLALHDEAGNITFLNKAFTQTIGYTVDEIPTLADWWPRAYPDPNYRQLVVDTWQKNLEEAKQTKKPFAPLELNIRCKNDAVRTFMGSAAALDDQFAGNHLVTLYDITERKRAEEELQTSENHLSNALEMAHLGHWEYDVANDVFTFNDQFYKIFRTTVEQVGGYAMSSAEYARRFVHPDDMDMVVEETRKAIEATDPHFARQVEHRMRYADGTVGHLAVRFFIVKDADGRTVKTYGVNQDITGRKRTEEALKHSHDLMRYIIEHNQSAVAVHDRDMKYIYVSQRYLHDYKVQEKDVLGKHHYDVFPDLPQKWRDVHQKALAGEISSAEEDPYVREDGSVDWTRWECRPWYEADSTIGGLIVYTEVITERKRAEEALRQSRELYSALFNLLPATGVVLTDELGQIVDANLAAVEILGLSRFDTLARTFDSPNWSILRPDGTPMPVDEYASIRALRELQQVNDVEMGILRPDGGLRWVLASATPIPIAGLGVSISFTDITARKEMEAQNRQLQKAESLGLMAGSIAHHFNNKLQAVMGNLELMGALPKGTDLTQFLTNAKLAAIKAAEMSRTMQVYLGQTMLNREPQFLSGLCRDSLLLIQKTLPKTVTLETDFPAPGPVVTANASQLQQVLTNLLTNAWEAMGKAGGCLRLSLKTCPAEEIPTTHRFPIGWQPQEPEYAVLEVMDTGCGIAEEYLEKLFDPFYSTQFVGRGLGLPVVLGIIQAHHGAITVESQPGHGSAFRVYFPVSAETMPTVQEHAVQAPESGASATGGTILLIDDDELLRMATQDLVQLLGFTPLTAKDGVEGVEVFRQHQAAIRCVITDLTMPRMDGWETLTALRQLDPTLPVILASGFDKAQVLSGSHPDRPNAFLGKPFDLQQLQDALGQAMVVSGLGAKDF